MKEYWKRKAEDFRTKPREFYKAFKPFLDIKVGGTDSRFVNLKVKGRYERNQATVANYFASYFSSVAMDTGDPNLLTSTEEQLEESVNNEKYPGMVDSSNLGLPVQRKFQRHSAH